MRRAAALAACLLLGACAAATVPATTPLAPQSPATARPVAGSVTGFLGGAPAFWETLATGADGTGLSARLALSDGAVRLTIDAAPTAPGTGALRIEATLPAGPVPGAAIAPLVTLDETADGTGARLASVGTPLLTVATLSRSGTDGAGRVSGTFVATLCPAAAETAPPDPAAPCVDIAGEFETRVQFDGV